MSPNAALLVDLLTGPSISTPTPAGRPTSFALLFARPLLARVLRRVFAPRHARRHARLSRPHAMHVPPRPTSLSRRPLARPVRPARRPDMRSPTVVSGSRDVRVGSRLLLRPARTALGRSRGEVDFGADCPARGRLDRTGVMGCGRIERVSKRREEDAKKTHSCRRGPTPSS